MSHVLVQIDGRRGARDSRQSFFSNRSTLFLFLRAELLLLTVRSGAARLYVGLYRSSRGIRGSTSSRRKNGSSTSSSFTKSTGSLPLTTYGTTYFACQHSASSVTAFATHWFNYLIALLAHIVLKPSMR